MSIKNSALIKELDAVELEAENKSIAATLKDALNAVINSLGREEKAKVNSIEAVERFFRLKNEDLEELLENEDAQFT